MPIQIIPRREKADAGDAFAKAIMGFLEAREENKKKQLEEKQFAEESQELQKHFGKQFITEDEDPFDFSKIKHPSLRKSFVTEGLKSKAKQFEIDEIKRQFPEYFEDTILPEEAPSIREKTPSDATFSEDISPTERRVSRPKKHSESEILRMQAINPGMAHQMREENKQITSEEKIASKEALEIHKESKDYYDHLLQVNKTAKTQYDAAIQIEKSVKAGKINPKSLANIFQHVPKVGKLISDAILTKDEATLKANMPFLLEGWKDVFGVRLSDSDLEVLLDKLPDIGKSPEANLAVTQIIKNYAQLGMLKYQIGRDIKRKGGKLRQAGFEDSVEEEFENQTRLVDIYNEEKNLKGSIPKYLLPAAQKKGYKLINE